MVKWSSVILICCFLSITPQISALHHGAAGLFDITQTVEVMGSVKRWSFVNPHPILVVEVTDDNGDKNEWDIYFGPPGASILRNRGYGPNTFRFGEFLTVRGNPARAAGVRGIDVFGAAGSVMRPDGTKIP